MVQIYSEYTKRPLLHKVPVNSVSTPLFHNNVGKLALWIDVDKEYARSGQGFTPFVDKFPQVRGWVRGWP